jgi:ribosome recycling factor
VGPHAGRRGGAGDSRFRSGAEPGERAKAAGRYAEGAKIAVRGVRRDGMDQIKTFEKKHEISEDDSGRWSDEVQKLTDQYIKRVDESLVEKEREIRQV